MIIMQLSNYYFVNVNSVYMKALQRKVIMTLESTEKVIMTLESKEKVVMTLGSTES